MWKLLFGALHLLLMKMKKITGFKLFYRERDSKTPLILLAFKSSAILTTKVTELKTYTEYEFELLAFNFFGDGLSLVKVVRTKEDGKRLENSFSTALFS